MLHDVYLSISGEQYINFPFTIHILKYDSMLNPSMIAIQHVAVVMDSPKNISHYRETFLVELFQTLQLLYNNTSIEFHKTKKEISAY